MEDMVKRVARAIYDNLPNENYAEPLPSEGEFSPAIIECARAAIAAMREPTDKMLDACDDFDIYWGYRADGRPGGLDDCWRAMVGAALGESAEYKESEEAM